MVMQILQRLLLVCKDSTRWQAIPSNIGLYRLLTMRSRLMLTLLDILPRSMHSSIPICPIQDGLTARKLRDFSCPILISCYLIYCYIDLYFLFCLIVH